MLSGAAFAQQKQSFDIPAQAAAAAIQSWAQQSGLQVFAAEDDLRGVRTNQVHGDFSAVEAAQMLVAGTGLEVIATGENTITIRRSRPGSTDGGSDEKFSTPQQSESLMEVIVTGSRIRRAGFDTLEATLTSDSKQIERRGYTNVGEALKDMPGFGRPDADPVGTTQATHSVGQTFVNLFNLGSQRTLVLVNGRRFVSSNSLALGTPAGSQVDLNTIPVGLIDRAEVVSIGGAPVYGSDAIAGTVNVILKKDFEGFQTSAQYGTTDHGDGDTRTFRTLIGGNFAENRGNIALGIEYNETDALMYRDRFPEFWDRVPNPLDTGDSDGIPARVIGTERFAALTEGGLPYNNARYGDFGIDFPGWDAFGVYARPNYIYDSAGTPLRFGNDGNLVPYNAGRVLDDANGLLPVISEGGDGMSPADHFPLLSPTRRMLINAIGHYDLTDNVRAIFEASYAHTAGRELSELYVFAAPGILGGPRLTFAVDNPFLTQQAHDTLVANLGAGATFDLNRNLNDITDHEGGRTEVDLYRMVGGFEGEFGAWGDTLHWDISFNYGRSRGVSELIFINSDRLQQAINATRDGNGNIVCADASNGCVPLNLFGMNRFSHEAFEWVTDPATAVSVNTQRVVTANLAGRLPFGIGGNIAFNVGAEHREEEGSFASDSAFRTGDTLLGGPGEVAAAFDAGGKYHTNEVYTELVAPMIADEWNWRAIKTASLEGAVRYVDHSIAGGDTTWSVGGRIAPRLPGWGDGLLFRGVYTEAIRSPAIRELFTNTPTTNPITDPCDVRAVDGGPNPAARRANCEAALAAAGVANPATFNTRGTTGLISPSGRQVGNEDLANEKAESWSVGLVYQPIAYPRLRLALDWASVTLKGGIEALDIETQMGLCYDSAAFPNNAACDGFHRYTQAEIDGLPAGSPPRQVGDLANGYRASYFNLSKTKFEGAILAAESDFDVGPGTGRVGTNVMFTNKFEQTVFPGDVPVNAAGLTSFPRYTAQLNLGYHWRDLDIDWQTLWKSAVEVDRNVDPELLQDTHIRSYASHNLTLGYHFTDSLRAQFGVVNVLDEDIPRNALARGFSVYDPIGRRYFMTLFADFH